MSSEISVTLSTHYKRLIIYFSQWRCQKDERSGRRRDTKDRRPNTDTDSRHRLAFSSPLLNACGVESQKYTVRCRRAITDKLACEDTEMPIWDWSSLFDVVKRGPRNVAFSLLCRPEESGTTLIHSKLDY